MAIWLSWMGPEPLVAIHAVLLVSGLSQSDVSLRTVALRSSVDVAREYRPIAVPSPDDVELPANLIVPPLYRSMVESMRQRSATFRRQCLRIAGASQLTVGTRSRPAACASACPRVDAGCPR